VFFNWLWLGDDFEESINLNTDGTSTVRVLYYSPKWAKFRFEGLSLVSADGYKVKYPDFELTVNVETMKTMEPW
jgi:hypothetical protein